MPAESEASAAARVTMVQQIDQALRRLAPKLGALELAPALRQAMLKVPRERFVPGKAATLAYLDRPLPIGRGQTISQPLIVALMTQLLQVEPGHKVLEIGTGSGYQAAVLAELGAAVYGIERIAALAEQAAERLALLGYGDVHLRLGDGAAGWPEQAPFRGIIVTAAAVALPPALPAQLAPGGRLVLPLGHAGDTQMLTLIERQDNGRVSERPLLPVAFVPLLRDTSAAAEIPPRR